MGFKRLDWRRVLSKRDRRESWKKVSGDSGETEDDTLIVESNCSVSPGSWERPFGKLPVPAGGSGAVSKPCVAKVQHLVFEVVIFNVSHSAANMICPCDCSSSLTLDLRTHPT
jgi:hypothetical protein